jgi:glycosyltransferase involved in cell wall biosynthesis
MDTGGELNVPVLSVVLPAHRADDYLRDALRSAEVALARLDAELVVVANGPAREAVAQLVLDTRTLESTRVVQVGIPALVHCLNRGLEEARGEYVARFDSDDLCLPERFVHQLRLARETGADFLFGAAEIMLADGAQAGRTQPSGTRLWRVCEPMHPTALMRRSALLELGGYGNMEYSEDYHLWLRAAARGHRLVADGEPVIRYRVHAGQATDKAKLEHTFATNAGIKLTAAMRERSPLLLAGALTDVVRFFYRVCRNAFW